MADALPTHLTPSAAPASIRPLYVIFLLSGLAGLVYEVVWTRKLLLIFGCTSFAVGTVLAAFMGGLALGSRWLGARADRSPDCLRLYARLELAIGAYGLASPFLVPAVHALYGAFYTALDPGFALSVALRLVLAGLFVLVPTTLMGGTLPVLARFLSQSGTSAVGRIGILYAVNTAGAVIGTVLGGLWLMPTIGINLSLAVAGLINILAGLLALALRERLPSPAPAPAAPEPLPPVASGAVDWILPAVLVSGFASFLYESAWTRSLYMIVGSTHDAIAVMLAAFLVGIAAGSAAIARRAERTPDPAGLFVRLECAIGATALFVPWLLGQLPYLLISWHATVSESDFRYTAFKFGISFVAMVGPTILIGATFPVAARIFLADRPDVGGRLGRLYGWNTVGCILGALGACFVLIPTVGSLWVTRIGALANAVAAALLLARGALGSTSRSRGWAWVAVVPALLAVVPAWDWTALTAGAYAYAHRLDGLPRDQVERAIRGATVLYEREGLDSLVTVEEVGQALILRVNGKTEAAAAPGQIAALVLLSEIPCQLHPDPHDALVIGWGLGISAGALTRQPMLRSIDVVELEQAVLGSAGFFREYNFDAIHDPRLHVQVNDGRNFVAFTSKRYDVITSDAPDAWISGPSHLFTLEHLQSVKAHLNPGGILSQWVALGWLQESAIRSILKTFHEVFAHVEIWQSNFPIEDVIVASDAPLVFDRARFLDRLKLPSIRQDLERVGLTEPAEFLACRVGEIPRAAWESVPTNTDDFPLVEFTPPANLRRVTAGGARPSLLRWRGLAYSLALAGVPDAERPAFLAALAQGLEKGADPLAAVAVYRELARFDESAPGPRVEAARLLIAQGRADLALEEAEAALRHAPDDPRASALRARSLFRMGKWSDASGAFEQVIARGGGDPELGRDHALCLQRLDRWEISRPLLERYLEKVRGDPDALTGLARYWEHEGDRGRALARAEEALAHEKRPTEREALAGMVNRLKGR